MRVWVVLYMISIKILVFFFLRAHHNMKNKFVIISLARLYPIINGKSVFPIKFFYKKFCCGNRLELVSNNWQDIRNANIWIIYFITVDLLVIQLKNCIKIKMYIFNIFKENYQWNVNWDNAPLTIVYLGVVKGLST